MKKNAILIGSAALLLLLVLALQFGQDPELPGRDPSGHQPAPSPGPDVVVAPAPPPTLDRTVTQDPTGKEAGGGSPSDRWLLAGVVRNEDGSRASDLLVRCALETFFFERTELPPVRTDSSGRYAFDLESWRHRSPLDRDRVALLVSITAPKLRGHTFLRFPADADAERGLTIEGDIRLEPLATVIGRVIDTRGEPVPGALVALQTDPVSHDIMPPTDYTDDDGIYRLAIGMDGPHVVDARRLDIGIGRLPVRIVRHQHVDLPDLVLEAPSKLLGQAIYPDGEPVADARLVVDGRDTFQTDASGRFALHHLKPGTHRISPPFRADEQIEVTTGAGFQQVTIQNARLRMRFVDARNRPLMRQNVSTYWFPESAGDALQAAPTLDSLPAEVRKLGVDYYEHGADMFAPRGSWFWIETPHGAQQSAMCVVQMRRDRNETIATLRFAAPTLDAKVHITARLADGTPIDDLFVQLLPLARGPRVPFEKIEDVAAGKAMRIPAGSYRLQAWQGWTRRYPDTFRWEEDVQIAPGELYRKEVTFVRGGLVAVEVHRHGGQKGARLDAEAFVTLDGRERGLGPWRVLDPRRGREVERDHLTEGTLARSKLLLPVGHQVIRLRSGDEVWTAHANVVAGEHTKVRFDLDR